MQKLIECKTRPEKLLWLDLETGGLEFQKQPIIEIAAIVTKGAFDEAGRFHRVLFASETQIESFEEVAKKMHQENGLISKLANGISLKEAEDQLVDFCKAYFKDNKIILAGNSVHWDRAYLMHWMPRFSKMLSHRILDVSSWKTFFQLEYGKEFKKSAPHLAMTDIEMSFLELKTYAQFIDSDSLTSTTS